MYARTCVFLPSPRWFESILELIAGAASYTTVSNLTTYWLALGWRANRTSAETVRRADLKVNVGKVGNRVSVP